MHDFCHGVSPLFISTLRIKSIKMKITINDHRKVFAIKDEFNKEFPGFKIEFLEKPSKSGSPPSKKLVKRNSKTLGQARLAHNKGVISVTPGMTVSELEADFRDVFELAIQVFQKSGKEWTRAAGNVTFKM